MEAEILGEVCNAHSYVTVIGEDICHIIHDITPYDDEEELNYEKKGHMNHLSLPHGQNVLAPSLNEGRAHLHIHSSRFVAL